MRPIINNFPIPVENPSLHNVKGLKASLWNARSLKNKTMVVNEYKNEHNLDILFFTESWLKPDDQMEIGEIENAGEFKFLTIPRSDRKGGGVGCLHKTSLDVKMLNTSNLSTFEHMALQIKTKHVNMTVIVIYRPEPSPKHPYKMADFFLELTNLLAHFSAKGGELLVLGDFNFHVNKCENVHVKKFTDILNIFDLVQHINQPTHSAGNTLDLVITRANSTVLNKWAIDELISDHNSILFNLNLTQTKKVKKVIKYRKTRNMNLNKFKLDLKHFFSKVINNAKVNINQNHLNNLISNYESSVKILDKHAPLLEKSVTLRKVTPWNTDQIKEAKCAKRKAEKVWRKSRKESDLALYKDKRNEYNTLLYTLKTKDLTKKINENKGNSKALFKIVNSAINKKQDLPLPPHDDTKVLATEFSNFFENKIDKIRFQLDNERPKDGPNIQIPGPPNFNGNPMQHFAIMDKEEIRKIIRDMPPKHSKLDPVPTWIVKECIDEYLPIITEIINTSLTLGIMPRQLKHAIIKPLLKKQGLDTIMKNYRPVSNLKFLSKIVESAIIKQFTLHLNVNNLQDPNQSAYKSFHSTETLLTKIHNDIMLNGNNGDITLLVLLDLSAAFDTIDHDILVQRLEHKYGIKGTALNWFRSYLSDRTQSVVIEDTNSEKKYLKYGVPQGSKLGPILFNSYIAPVSEIAHNHNIIDEKYADDEQLILSFKPNPNDAAQAKDTMQKCIKDIRIFLQKNKLCNNGEKTEIILIGQKTHIDKLEMDPVEIGDTRIIYADNVKNLGAIFDKHMTMEKQVNKMCKAAYFNIRNIAKIRKSLSKDDVKAIVNALVTPHLDYANSTLFGISEKLKNKLQIAQNSAVRLIERLRLRDHITEHRKNLHWLPVDARIKYKILTLTWKALNDQAPIYLTNLIKKRHTPRPTRSLYENLLDPPNIAMQNSWGRRAFSSSSPYLWNNLPRDLRQQKKLESFKKKLKTHLFSLYYT